MFAGAERQTRAGRHFEMSTIYENHRRHGSMEIARLRELPHDLLESMPDGELPRVAPEKWVFLDTETTGLAGGSGTCAFLAGVGRITGNGFEVRQFFMRDYDEEASLLEGLSESIADAEILVTYNGRCFDVPLLETRYTMHRARTPFARLGHLDLLYGARRLWRLRFDSCRLMQLESSVLGLEREDDVPGQLIPHLYFQYLRTRRAEPLAGVFRHNVLDIVTLACLTGIVPWAFRTLDEMDPGHPAEMVSLGRWVRQAGRIEQARDLFRRALRRGLDDELAFRTLWDLAELEKKLKRYEAAAEGFAELASCRNPFRVQALEELAKHYEHRERDYEKALGFTLAAIGFEPSEALDHRRGRLERLCARPKAAAMRLSLG